MNRNECDQLIERYLEWLKKGLSIEKIDNACELTTPFLDRHNDQIQIYAQKKDGKIILSDDGYILADLRTSGLELNTSKRKMLFDATLAGFGVREEGKKLFVEASTKNLGQRVHSLLQAMIAVNDMFMMSQPRVATFFWEDVKNFLDSSEVRYNPRVKLTGKTGYDHGIDFLIPKSVSRPERIVQAINSPEKNTIATYLFVLEDTRVAREEKSEAYAFLNDSEREIGGDVMEALDAYNVVPVIWSNREKFVSALAN